MADVFIRFPVTCPVCGQEALTAVRAETIIDSLDSRAALRLSSTCHDASWLASAVEEEQIREYLFTTIGFTKSSDPWITTLDPGRAEGMALGLKRDPNLSSR